MAQVIPFRRDRHDEVQQLLPWYVTDRLDPGELQMVEAHLTGCVSCRDDLASERALAAMVKANEVAAQDGWSALRGRLNADAGQKRAAATPPRRRRTAILAGSLAAAVVAIVAVPVMNTGVRTGGKIYHTLSDATPRPVGNVLVMFRTDSDQPTRARSIEAAGGEIVRGPMDTGAYLIAVPSGQRPEALRTLHASPDILLAEPIDTPTP